MIERQELWCHECSDYVQFNIDLSLNGNHVIICPKCGHEHLRVVKNGIITEERWGQRNNTAITLTQAIQTYTASGITSSGTSTFTTYSGSSTNSATSYHAYSAWMNYGQGGGYI